MIAHRQAEALQLSAELAAAGRYPAALKILDVVPAEEMTLEMKVLRAKILSQQGDFARAVDVW